MKASTASLVDGVDLNDVIEAVVASLGQLAAASMICRDAIAELNLGPVLLKMKDDDSVSEEVSEACLVLLEELRIDNSNARRGSAVSAASRAKPREAEEGPGSTMTLTRIGDKEYNEKGEKVLTARPYKSQASIEENNQHTGQPAEGEA